MTVTVQPDGSIVAQYDDHRGEWWASVAEFKASHSHDVDTAKVAQEVMLRDAVKELESSGKLATGERTATVNVQVTKPSAEVVKRV